MWKRSLRSSIEFAALLLIVAITSTPAGTSAAETDSIADLAREVLSDGSYQTECPAEMDGAGVPIPIGLGRS
jgi:hypothetical protein